MQRIVKGGFGCVPAYTFGEPVKIDNTVYIPGEDEETGEFISAEELKRRAEEEKAAEEKRFNEAVDAKVTDILTDRQVALDKEYADTVAKGREEAAAIAAKAKADTMAVMEKAKRECAILKEQAKKEGHDEGYAEGRQESLEKYKKYIDASGRLLEEINSRKEAYYISNEEEMRDTVFALVDKIVRTELRTNPKVIEGIMAEAARNFRNSDYLKITLAEDDVTERFRTDEKLVKDIIPFIPEVEVELDRDADEGTIIEDDGSQIVDAGIPTQLEFLREIVKNSRGEGITAPQEGAEELADSGGAVDEPVPVDVSVSGDVSDEGPGDITELSPEMAAILGEAIEAGTSPEEQPMDSAFAENLADAFDKVKAAEEEIVETVRKPKPRKSSKAAKAPEATDDNGQTTLE